MLSSIEQLLKALDENKITYCHWKSNEHLSPALQGDTDLDVLFDPAQRTELERVLDECGLKRFRATPKMQYNAIEDFIGFDQEAAKIWHLHTHYRMTLGSNHLKEYTITPWGKKLLKDRIRGEENVWTSAPADELVLLLSRVALKLRGRDLGKKLGEDDLCELAWLKKRVTKEKLAASAEKLLGARSRAALLDLYDCDLRKKSQFRKLKKALKKELKPFTGYSSFSAWATRLRREFFWLCGGIKRRLGKNNYAANRRISPAGGLVVAILGCDGAGKSTTLSYVKKEFNKKIDTVSIYLGSGDGSSSLLRKPMKLIAKKVGGKGVGHAVEKEYSEKKRVSFKARLYSAAKILWAITLANEKKKKLRKLVRARNNGLLVLTDRYPQTNMPGAGDGPLLSKYKDRKGPLGRISRKEQKIYERFSENAPDLAIKLVVPTEVAIARKPEMTKEEIEHKKAIVMGMEIADRTAIIDTSRPFEITRGEVMREIWNLI